MNSNLVKSALFSLGLHLSVLMPFFHPIRVSSPPAVDLTAGTSSVELEWAEKQPAEEEAEEPAPEKMPARAASQEQWVADPGVVQATSPGSAVNPAPLYPRIARLNGWEGTAVIRALVSPSGGVASAQAARSSGHTILDGAALAAVRQWKFQPARHKGQAVASQVEIPVTFRLKQQREE